MKKTLLALALIAGLLGAAYGTVQFIPTPWGDHGLRVDSDPKIKGNSLFRIVKDGQTKRSISAVDFEAYLVELTGQGSSELWLRAKNAGKTWTDYFFTLEGGLRNLGIVDGQGSGITQIEDLDNDGKAEIAMFGTPLSFLVGLDNTRSPFLTNVLTWDGIRLADSTVQYPKRIRTTILFHYYDYLRAVEQNDMSGQKSGALGYYANSLQIGEGRIAKAWLMNNVPEKDMRRWLLDNESRMINTFYSYPGCRIAVTQTRTLPVPYPTCAK
ncbi:MAG: hypothetical protein RLZZ156_1363 [Deinococcota bacterium]|jgi:hypothetical protein